MLEHSELLRQLSYNKDDGIFTWRIDHHRPNGMKGMEAGYKGGKGYVRIMIYAKEYRRASLAHFYMTKEWPKMVDHIDHVSSNDRWDNLRACTQKENMRNTSLLKNNTSGVTGVSWHAQSQRWQAGIKDGGKRISLGNHYQKWDAICARKSAEYKFGYHPNHGLR